MNKYTVYKEYYDKTTGEIIDTRLIKVCDTKNDAHWCLMGKTIYAGLRYYYMNKKGKIIEKAEFKDEAMA